MRVQRALLLKLSIQTEIITFAIIKQNMRAPVYCRPIVFSLKKHDKLMTNEVCADKSLSAEFIRIIATGLLALQFGLDWRINRVEKSSFFLNRDVETLIGNVENDVIIELEGGDRQAGMKRLKASKKWREQAAENTRALSGAAAQRETKLDDDIFARLLHGHFCCARRRYNLKLGGLEWPKRRSKMGRRSPVSWLFSLLHIDLALRPQHVGSKIICFSFLPKMPLEGMDGRKPALITS